MNPPPLPAAFKQATDMPIPATIVTCSKDGIPNTTVLSKVYWVDDDHVALSFQFFNKTIRNVRENPRVAIELVDPQNAQFWDLDLEYIRSETEGPIFDEMDMAIQALASMSGLEDVFKLQAADIYRVHGYRTVPFV